MSQATSNVVYPAAFRRIKPPTPHELQQLRKRLRMNQTVFAKTFHFKLGTYRHWEKGYSSPGRTATLFLRLIMQDPDTLMDMLDRLPKDLLLSVPDP